VYVASTMSDAPTNAFWTRGRGAALMAPLYDAVTRHAADDVTVRARLRRLERVLGTGATTLGSDSTLWRKGLDSPWLRRIAVRVVEACLVEHATRAEVAETLQRTRRALRVDQHALPRTRAAESPEALIDAMAVPLVDWLRWDDEAEAGLAWQLPMEGAALAAEARVDLALGQALALVRGGELVASLEEPVIDGRLAQVSPAACDGPLAQVDAVFISLRQGAAVRWGSESDIELGPDLVLRVFGRYSVSVTSVAAFVHRFARHGLPDPQALDQRIGRVIAGRFAEALRALHAVKPLSLEDAATSLPAMAAQLRPSIEPHLAAAGLKLTRFDLENITLPGLGVAAVRTTTPSGVRSGTPLAAQVSCHKCLSPVPAHAKFCSTCGARQTRPCPHCGVETAARAKFCSACGRSVPPPAT
jgi:hypothetical protein